MCDASIFLEKKERMDLNRVGFFYIDRMKLMCRVAQLIKIRLAKKAKNKRVFLKSEGVSQVTSLVVCNWLPTVKTYWSFRSFITNNRLALLTHIQLKLWNVSPKRGFGEQWGVTPAEFTITSADKQHQSDETQDKRKVLKQHKMLSLTSMTRASTRDGNPIRRKLFIHLKVPHVVSGSFKFIYLFLSFLLMLSCTFELMTE